MYVDSAREAWAVDEKMSERVAVPWDRCQKLHLVHQCHVMFSTIIVSGSPGDGATAFHEAAGVHAGCG